MNKLSFSVRGVTLTIVISLFVYLFIKTSVIVLYVISITDSFSQSWVILRPHLFNYTNLSALLALAPLSYLLIDEERSV